MAMPSKRFRRTSLIFGVVATVIIFAIIAQSWWAIEQDRRLTIQSEYEHGLVAVRLLEEHATQTLKDAERNLDSVITTIRSASKQEKISDQQIRNLLTKAQPFNRILKALQFVNPQGIAWVSSIDYPAYQTDADDRTYIPFLLAHQHQTDIVIGKPFQRFYDAEWVVPIARNVYTDDGQFLGILSTDISISYFSNVYERVAKDSKALVSLFTKTGTIIVRFPFDQSLVGHDVSTSRFFQQLASGPVEGISEDRRFLDETNDTARLYVYRKVTDYPVVSVFSRETATILEPWKQRSINRIEFTTLTIILICLLLYFLRLQISRLQSSEDSLLSSEADLRLSENKFTNLFEYSPVPLAVIRESDDTILEVNTSLLILLGYTRPETLGQSLQSLGVWQSQDAARSYRESMRKQGYVIQFEASLLDRSKQALVCQISSRCFESAGEKLQIFSPINISRLREIEVEVRQLNTRLEEKVSERTQSLELANRELEQALQTMKNMQEEMFRSEKMAALGYLVAGISHELNTPIGNSLMVASTLFDHTGELLQEMTNPQTRRSKMLRLIEDSKKGADILVRNLQRSAQLIASFKQVAVDQSSDQCREFNLKKTIEETTVTLEPLYKRTEHQLITDLAENISMHSYPGAISQIITNCVNNALVHGFEHEEHGRMHLSCRQLNEQEVEIVFQDNGAGIPSENLTRVFDPFFTTKLGQGGSGLGLNIVYNLVTEILGGTITLDSKINQGTTITMRLPISAPSKAE